MDVETLIEAKEHTKHLVKTFGEVYLPLFERLEREIEEKQAKQRVLERAMAD